MVSIQARKEESENPLAKLLQATQEMEMEAAVKPPPVKSETSNKLSAANSDNSVKSGKYSVSALVGETTDGTTTKEQPSAGAGNHSPAAAAAVATPVSPPGIGVDR